MAQYFAEIKDNVVTQVIVADQSFVDSIGGDWVETDYDGKFRKNYAGLGYSYDSTRDAFIPPKPYDSWLLDEETCLWKSPVDMPTDGKIYQWEEATQNWAEQSL